MPKKIVKPILDSGLFESIENALVMYSNRDTWKTWGMNQLREQGAALLFHGKTGTGKTITAKWIAHSLDLRFRSIDYSEMGGAHPGELSKNIKYLFMSAQPKDDEELVSDTRPCLILLDECDTMLVSRKKLAYNTMWMLEPINQLLMSIRQYPGLVILATNAELDFLDSALDSRILGKFHFTDPQEELTRVNLWKSKWPLKLPVKLNDKFLSIASKYPYNGAQIENFIIEWTSQAIRTSGNSHPSENLHLDKLIEMLIK